MRDGRWSRIPRCVAVLLRPDERWGRLDTHAPRPIPNNTKYPARGQIQTTVFVACLMFCDVVGRTNLPFWTHYQPRSSLSISRLFDSIPMSKIDVRRWRYYCTPWWSFLLLSHTCIALVADSNFSATGSSKLRQYWFDTIIDHFNFRRPASSNGSFPLRYFVSEEFLGKQPSSSPPCFFYAGNEADITTFIKNSGFLFEAAKEMRALIVFAEHRYYGQSYPFGGASTALTPQNISYLTVASNG